MTDSNIQNDPLKLYRQYQETRDDIHPTVFNALREKAHAESNEDAIYELIQIAKTSQNSQNILESNSTFEEKKSWFNKLFTRSNNAFPQMGMAVACMVFVVFLVPIAMNSGNQLPNFSSTVHLSDCGECIAYVANASVSTRGANSRGLTKEQKQSTQLGVVSGKLQVLAATSREEPNSFLQCQCSTIHCQCKHSKSPGNGN